MKLIFVAVFILLNSLYAEAAFQCTELFPKSAAEIIDEVNTKYENLLYESPMPTEYRQLETLRQKYKLYRYKKLLQKYDKEHGDDMSYHDRLDFVNRLNRLAFATAVNKNSPLWKKLTWKEQLATSETRRKLLMEGFEKTMLPETMPKTVKQKIIKAFLAAFSIKYVRWSWAEIIMPKLVGLKVSLEQAQRFALDGIDAHPDEVDALFPEYNSLDFYSSDNAVLGRALFNKFSTTYNYMVVLSIFASLGVVDYEIHHEYRKGVQNAVAELHPLASSSEDMANEDREADFDLIAFQNYQIAFKQKYGRDLTEQEQQLVIHTIASRHAQDIRGTPQ